MTYRDSFETKRPVVNTGRYVITTRAGKRIASTHHVTDAEYIQSDGRGRVVWRWVEFRDGQSAYCFYR